MNYLKLFLRLIQDQFKYGGRKYAHSKQKESTDVLFDDFGKNWLFGTIAKYIKRYSNLARERDLLKIACYMFILWLKRGFHLNKEGSEKPIDTTVEIKTKYFNLFKNRIENRVKNNIIDYHKPLQKIYKLLYKFGQIKFNKIPEKDLTEIFILSYYIWKEQIPLKGKDLDTWLERK